MHSADLDCAAAERRIRPYVSETPVQRSEWLSALCGALGLLTFYLALDRGSASLAVPVIGFYPAVVAVHSVAFLDEKLSGLQVLGVALAVSGVALIGAAG